MGLAVFVLIATFIILLLMDVPVAFCIGMATLVTMVVAVDFVPATSATAITITTVSYTHLTLPTILLV